MNENLRMKRPGYPYRRNKGALILVLACGVLSTGWLSGCGKSDTGETVETEQHTDEKPGLLTLNPAAEQNMGLQTEVVARRTVNQTLRATGSVGPNDTRVAHLRPLARGRIERVFVRLGDRVRSGQPVVAYDNIELGERARLRRDATDGHPVGWGHGRECTRDHFHRALPVLRGRGVEMEPGATRRCERRDKIGREPPIIPLSFSSRFVYTLCYCPRRFALSTSTTGPSHDHEPFLRHPGVRAASDTGLLPVS